MSDIPEQHDFDELLGVTVHLLIDGSDPPRALCSGLVVDPKRWIDFPSLPRKQCQACKNASLKSMSDIPAPTPEDLQRDLSLDYALCLNAEAKPWEWATTYLTTAISGWPATIRRAVAAEAEVATYQRGYEAAREQSAAKVEEQGRLLAAIHESTRYDALISDLAAAIRSMKPE